MSGSDSGGVSDESAAGDGVSLEDDGVLQWLLRADDGNAVFVRDVLGIVAIVTVIALILFGVSGVWPPFVAVESPSMEPNMQTGDLVFVVDDERFVGDDPVEDTGVVALESGRESGHEKFGKPGDVIVFQPNGNERETPIIHRAHFHVERGENWVETKADEDIVGDLTCDDVTSCPAPHDGFVTKGDANGNYDQIGRTSGADTTIVKPEWITGKAMFQIPWLGHLRLTAEDILGGAAAPAAPTQPSAPALEEPGGPATPTTPITSAGLAGATGVAAVGVGIATAVGRRRY